ncbi:pali-domain-containing protein [Agrocybe pediades]|nr:pali-domain-containing protein [Agrocybe pediades]
MSRAFCIPGVVFLALAFILSLLVSISLPSLRAIDIVRIDVDGSDGFENIDAGSIRLGIWSYCVEPSGVKTLCSSTGHGYSVPLTVAGGEIKSSWTKGLAVHPVATAFTFVALLLSFSTHLTVTLAASLVSFLAALLTLVAFAIDIALLLLTRHAINENFPSDAARFIHTNTAAGFWMTFVSLILLLLAGCTVCFGRRQSRMSSSSGQSYPLYENKGSIFSRFRNN